jgi:hypothetical protein
MLGGESAPQPWRLEPDERGEDRAAGPAGARGPGAGVGTGATQDGDLVPQHEQLGVLGGR